MAPEERVPDTGVCLPTDASGDRSELESLGMTEQAEALDAGHGNGHWAGQADAMDTVCSSEPLDTSQAVCADTSKSSELNHVGSMALVPHETQSENHLENGALVPRKLSVKSLKERLKDKLKEKLKPKLRLNYFKHRQESSLPVIPWVPANQNGHISDRKPLSSDVAPLKMLPAGVKTEPEEDGVLDVPSPFSSLGREPTGQLVVANVSNGRKKAAGNKTSPMSRVNRFVDQILQFVGERSVPEKLIRGALGNNPDISKAIRLLLSEKKLKRLGDGGKGCAYVYVRADLAEAKPKTMELAPVDHINAQALSIEREFVRELERRREGMRTQMWVYLSTSLSMPVKAEAEQLYARGAC